MDHYYDGDWEDPGLWGQSDDAFETTEWVVQTHHPARQPRPAAVPPASAFRTRSQTPAPARTRAPTRAPRRSDAGRTSLMIMGVAAGGVTAMGLGCTILAGAVVLAALAKSSPAPVAPVAAAAPVVAVGQPMVVATAPARRPAVAPVAAAPTAPMPVAAAPAAPSDGGWVGAATQVASKVASAIAGGSSAPSGLAPAGGTSPATAVQPVAMAPAPVGSNGDVDALIADLSADRGPTAADVVARAQDDSWMTAASTGVSTVAAKVASAVSGGTAAPATGPAPTSLASVTRANVDLLAGDDGLGVDLSGRQGDGWLEEARADDPAMAMLAELEAPPGARPAAAPVGSNADVDALIADLSADRGPTAADVMARAQDDSWMTAASTAVSTVAAKVATAVSGGTAPGATGEARAGDPAVAMLAELEASPGARPAAAPVAVGSNADVDALIADLSADRGPTAADVMARAQDDSWTTAASTAVSTVAAKVASAVNGGTAAAPTGPAPTSLASVTPTPGGATGSATFGSQGWASSEGTENVDLLAGDDGLAVDLGGQQQGDGWLEEASADDPALAMLAELDSPSAARPVARQVAGGTAVAPGAAPAAASSGGSADVDALIAGLAADRAGPTAADVQARAAADDSWLGAATAAVSAVSTQVQGMVSGTPAAPPQAVAAGTAPSLAATVATASTTWQSSEGQAGVDLLAEDDGMAALAANLGAEREREGWLSEADADDPALAMLAELDAPTGGTSVTAPAAGIPAAASVPGTPAPVADDGVDALIADIAADRAGPTAASVTAAPAPTTSWAGSAATSLVQSGIAFVTGGTSAAPPAAPAGAPVAAPPGATFANAAPARPAPPPRPVCQGELCEDRSVLSWRDDGTEVDLLSQEDVYVPIAGENTAVAELFYVPGADEALPSADDLAALDALNTLLVRVDVDVNGVPIEVDGKIVGSAPTVVEVTPGWHTVILHGDGVTSNFRLEARSDPQAWCFEARGRGFKDVRCL